MIFVVKGREKFWKIKRGRERKSLESPGLRCVYTECDEIFRTYSDVGYETVRGYDVKLRHYPRP